MECVSLIQKANCTPAESSKTIVRESVNHSGTAPEGIRDVCQIGPVGVGAFDPAWEPTAAPRAGTARRWRQLTRNTRPREQARSWRRARIKTGTWCSGEERLGEGVFMGVIERGKLLGPKSGYRRGNSGFRSTDLHDRRYAITFPVLAHDPFPTTRLCKLIGNLPPEMHGFDTLGETPSG